MDAVIKSSIEARKNAFNSFEVSVEHQKEIDQLFDKIDKLGESCKDAGEFENKFASSPLNQQYMDMFTKIATDSAKSATTKSIVAGTVTGAAETAIKNAIGANIPTTKAAVHQKAYDAARDIPVVGDAIDVGQKASYIKHLGGLFGKKNK